MKVCLITFEYPPREEGTGVSVRRIAKSLIRQGVEVYVFTIDSEEQDVPSTAKRKLTPSIEEGIPVHRYSPFSAHITNYSFNLKNMMFFLEELDKKYNFDIFHGFGVGGAGYMAVLMAKKRGKKSVVNTRGIDLDLNAYDSREVSIIKWTLEEADQIVFISHEAEELAKRLIEDTEDRCSVILNSIDSSEFYYLKKIPHLPLKGVVIGFSGALRSKKGFVYLLEAFKELCKEREATLLIVGYILKKQEPDYERMIAESGIQDKIILTGVIPHKYILNYINLMDIFILPSISEGCPNALLEAMYCKKPCIATSVGAVPEIIQNRENGILIKPYSPEQIYDAMVDLIENKKLAKELGENAYKTIKEKFTPERETKEWIECYRRTNYGVNGRENQNIGQLSVTIQPTNRCNLRCLMCSSYQNGEKKRDMSLEEFKSIIDKNHNLIKQIPLYHSGESLLNKDIWEMVRYAKEKGIPHVKISTNGMLLDKQTINKAIESRLDCLIVSLDGATEETYKKFRRGGDFKRVITNIKELVRQRNLEKSDLQIQIQFVVFSHNEKEIQDIIALSKELGADYVKLKTACISGKEWEYLLPTNKEYNRYTQETKERICNKIWKEITINLDGTITPCSYLPTKLVEKLKIGNVFNEDLLSILQGKRYQNFINELRKGKLGNSYCSKCKEKNRKVEIIKIPLTEKAKYEMSK